MKKIALLYLDVSNLGDIVIFETAKYICEDILKKNNLTDCEIVPVDIGSYRYKQGKPVYQNFFERGTSVFFRKAGKHLYYIFPHLGTWMMTRAWRMAPTFKHFKNNELHKIEDADLIIFGGGGLIKYHRQNFHYFLNEVTMYADAKNIPVLINAQGIEGYDKYQGECMLLKNAVNRNCVKYVSTRDDFAMLRNCYIDNPNIVVKGVCDPAFYVPETYNVKKSENPGKLIGLNVIRPRIFGEYMYKMSDEQLAKIYYDTIVELKNRGYNVEFFSNGTDSDTAFIEKAFKLYPDLMDKYQVAVALPETTYELVETISHYERFLAVRLHAAIIGTVLGIPNASLVWNRKQPLFGKQTGLYKNFLMKDDFTAEKIVDTLLNAKPYEMDKEYKASVYDNLEKQILKWI